MIEHNFCSSERPKAIGFSGSQFEFIVETFYRAGRNGLFGAKPIEKKLSVRAKHAGHFLHRFDARSHDFAAPGVKKLTRRGWVDILPEELKVFLEKVASHSFKIESQQVRQFGLLNIGKI